MTVFAEPVLRDPIEEFFDRGPQDDLEAERTHPDVVKVGVALAAAFIVLRAITKQRLAEEAPSTAQAARKLTMKVWKNVAKPWMQVSVPALSQAFKLGAAGRTYPELEKMATLYASDLGAYISQTSGEALAEGFAAQLNAGWSSDLAWIRSVEAWGLDKRQMRTYVTGLLKADRTAYSTTDPVSLAARSLVDRLFMLRADRLGINEAFRASQLGRNIAWLALQNAGDLPATAMKKWVTADDERVCEVCAPLNGVVIGLRERFESSGQKFHAPGVHPNCRCELELVYGDDIVKAAPGDPYDRDRKGRFSTDERRQPKVKTKTEMDPVLADLLRRAEKEYESTDFDPFAPSADFDPFASTGVEDPFASSGVEDPFVSSVDPFASDPFASDPFAQDDPFQAEMRRKARRLIIIRRFRNGKEEFETEVRESPEVKLHKNTTMYAPAGDFLSALAATRGVEKVQMNPKQWVQIDELSRPVPQSDGSLVQHVAEVIGVADTGAGAIGAESVAHRMAITDSFFDEFLPAFAEAVSSRVAGMADNDTDEEVFYSMDDFLAGSENALKSLQDHVLRSIARKAIENGARADELGKGVTSIEDVDKMDGDELAEAIADSLRFESQAVFEERKKSGSQGPTPWAQAVEYKVAPGLVYGSSTAAVAATDSSVSPGEGVDPPTIFVFDGFYGAVEGETLPLAFAQGTYSIERAELVHVTGDETKAIKKLIDKEIQPDYQRDLAYAALEAFKTCRMVYLRPVSPARMPKENDLSKRDYRRDRLGRFAERDEARIARQMNSGRTRMAFPRLGLSGSDIRGVHFGRPKAMLRQLTLKPAPRSRATRAARAWSNHDQFVRAARQGKPGLPSYFVSLVESAPANAPRLYRGMALTPESAQAWQPGRTVDLRMTSWTASRKVTGYFVDRSVKRNQGRIPVVLVMQPGGKALNISRHARHRLGEWVATGRATVVSRRMHKGVLVITVEHKASVR